MRYHEETGEAYQVPKYEILRSSLLPHKGKWLKLREIKNLCGLNSNTLKTYIEHAVKLGYIHKKRKLTDEYIYFRGKNRKVPRHVWYCLVTDISWYNLGRAVAKTHLERIEPRQPTIKSIINEPITNNTTKHNNISNDNNI